MISKIKWKNHNILGNLELDFKKEDGTIYNTVVIAGDNGTGKTTILETLASFLRMGIIEPFEIISYEVKNIPYEIIRDEKSVQPGNYIRKNKITEERIRIGLINTYTKYPEDLRNFGCVYSKARTGFNTNKITTSSINQLDSDKHEIDNNDDFTFVKQLLVDIDTQDNSEWMKITRAGLKTTFDEFKYQSRLYRFEKAFNNFFENIEFEGIDNSNIRGKDIIFKKYDKKISIDNMSTGEKQIVFRGVLLLKNLNNLSGGIVLIDEPELSMHPQWQKKILNYYRDLFKKDGVQNVQLIVATHSEYILQSALEDSENSLIITLKDNAGMLESKKIIAPSILPTVTLAETNYIAFGIVSTDYHNQLYGCLQNKIGINTVKGCDDYILAQITPDDDEIYKKHSSYNSTSYETLSTYIRNSIDHPAPNKKYTYKELEKSIELLIRLCKNIE
jgi:predicted ATPase